MSACVTAPKAISIDSLVANNFYVSTTGLDTNSGTLSQPWKTVQHAVNMAMPGDTIFVRAGTYNESVNLSKTGLAGSPITLSGYTGENATIDGGAVQPAIYEPGDATDIEYWVIENLTLRSLGQQTVALGYWGKTYTHNYNTIINNKVFGSIFIHGYHNLVEANDIDGTGNTYESLSGIEDAETVSHDNIFRDNYIHDISPIYGRGIWTVGYTHNDLIEGNIVTNVTNTYGQCIDSDGAGTVEWGHIIRNNKVLNCGNVGIQIENGFSINISNNYVSSGKNTQGDVIIINYGKDVGCKAGGENNQYGDSNGDGDCRSNPTGIVVSQNLLINGGVVGSIVSYDSAGVHVINNTIYGGSSVGLWLGNPTYTKQWDVRGNIFATESKAAIFAVDPTALSQDDYNLLFSSNANGVYQLTANYNFLSLAQYQSSYGKGLHSIQAAPRVINPGNGDFHLAANSPAIDACIDLGLKSDFDGNPRPQGNGYDIGAFEFTKSLR